MREGIPTIIYADSSSPHVSPTPEFLGDTRFSIRWNDSPVALGNLRRVHLWPFRGLWYLSPDLCAWYFPTGITVFLFLCTWYLTAQYHSVVEKVILVGLLSCAFVFSLLVAVTDPGVYPRLGSGERDPLEACQSLWLCKVCGIRRPPRASHCHTCGVCVLEHDHHCGVLGGCVGKRSLRWFTLYLLTVSSAAGIGMYWVASSLFQPSHPVNRQTVSDLVHKRNQNNPNASLSAAGHIFLLIFIGNVVLLVGGMGIYYLYLMLSDTTRREAQGKLPKASSTSGQSGNNGGGGMLAHVWNVFMVVPPSMLERPHSTRLGEDTVTPLAIAQN